MRKRTLIGAAATALACGMMVAAFCPGSAMAKYNDSTLDLTSAPVKNAVTMKVGTNYKASITDKDIVSGEQIDQIRVFKFTPAATALYNFKVTQYTDAEQEDDMYYMLYDSTGSAVKSFSGGTGSLGGVNLTDEPHPIELTKGATYYLVVSEYDLNDTWAETVSVSKTKIAKSATVTMLTPVSANVEGVFRATITYTDGTKGTAWNNVLFKYIDDLITDTFSDDEGNTVVFKELADDEDGSKRSALNAGTVGTYKINCSLKPAGSAEAVSAGSVNCRVVTDATQVASAKAVAVQSTMTLGFYKITARVAGLLCLEGDSAIYKYDAKAKSLTEISEGYTDDEGGYSYAASAKMTKGQVIYAQVLGSQKALKNGLPSLSAGYYVLNNNAAKVAQTIKVKKATATYKATALKKAAKSFAIGATAKTACTYKVISGAKWVKVTKAGKVTVKKGAKKGVYKVKVTAKTSTYYKAATRVITVRVK